MKSNFIHEAVRKISPNCAVVVRDNDTSKISFVENPDNITIQQIEDAIPLAEADFNATQYQRDRAEQYPSIIDVVVALAEKQEGNDMMWQEITAQRAKVKADNPKP